MVREGVVSIIMKCLEQKRPRKAKPWDQRYRGHGTRKDSNGHNRELERNIRIILNVISGDKVVEMLKGLLFLFFSQLKFCDDLI